MLSLFLASLASAEPVERFATLDDVAARIIEIRRTVRQAPFISVPAPRDAARLRTSAFVRVEHVGPDWWAPVGAAIEEGVACALRLEPHDTGGWTLREVGACDERYHPEAEAGALADAATGQRQEADRPSPRAIRSERRERIVSEWRDGPRHLVMLEAVTIPSGGVVYEHRVRPRMGFAVRAHAWYDALVASAYQPILYTYSAEQRSTGGGLEANFVMAGMARFSGWIAAGAMFSYQQRTLEQCYGSWFSSDEACATTDLGAGPHATPSASGGVRFNIEDVVIDAGLRLSADYGLVLAAGHRF